MSVERSLPRETDRVRNCVEQPPAGLLVEDGAYRVLAVVAERPETRTGRRRAALGRRGRSPRSAAYADESRTGSCGTDDVPSATDLHEGGPGDERTDQR